MRPLVAEIRLAHLRHNYRVLKEMHGQNLLAVVKADAYGHGAVQCAKALDDMADGFAVAFLEEAVTLRENGIKSPILLLEGVFEPHEYALVEQYGLWTVIHQQTQLEDCLAHDWKQPATVWLKMDSGMHRAGFFPHNYAAAYHALQQSPKIGKIVKMTHFACADDAERGMTEMQIDTFDTACEGLGGDSSLANSAAILAYPEARREWGRAGLALYGVSPFAAGAGCLAVKCRLAPSELVRQTWIAPVADFFHRYGKHAILLLALIGLYRVSDIVAGVISNVFYDNMGFSKEEIAYAVKSFGIVMSIAGGFVGGLLAQKYKIMSMMMLGAIATAATNLLFILLALRGHDVPLMYLAVGIDNLAGGFASTVFVVFLSGLTNIRFTAVQYALLSSLMTLSPKILGGYSGAMASQLGYPTFFLLTALMGVPILLLVYLTNRYIIKPSS